MSRQVSAAPGYRVERELTALNSRIRHLEERLARTSHGATRVVVGSTDLVAANQRTFGGYIVESAVLADDGHTVLWRAQNALTKGPPVTIATLG